MEDAARRSLLRIRKQAERVITVNPHETAEDAVRILCLLADPESAGRQWFVRWQEAHRMNERLRTALQTLLTKISAGEDVPTDMVAAMADLLDEARALSF